MPKITRAISIRQPYVELILKGSKRYEYRSTPTHVLERVYLYAAKKPADDITAWRKVGREPGELPTGKLLGTVVIAACEGSKKTGYRYKLECPKRFRTALIPKSQPQPKFFRPGL